MRKSSLFCLVVVTLQVTSFLVPSAGAAQAAIPAGTANGFQVRRGTNISHWLSQSQRRGAERAAFFTARDVAFLAEVGFDHLRIPVDEEQLWTEEGEPVEEAFGLLLSALDWCRTHHLRAIVDLHILRSHHFNEGSRPLWTDPAAQDHFLDLWRDLSARLRHFPVDQVAYELMNEPVADDPEAWNRLLARAVEVLRSLEPERTLVIGSNRWQSVDTFDRLRVPEGDPNILLSFHFYTPMALTHYRAGWTKVGEYQGPIHYPGVVVRDEDLAGLPEDLVAALRDSNRHYDRDVLESLLRKPLELAKKLRLPLYCGEWGVYRRAPREPRLRWYRDMRSVLEANGIGWATWDYKGGFGIVDAEGGRDRELIGILTARP
ncbi:MAG: glycoside hydrolase family 5 protein [Acidobacteriota bacterium]